MRSHSPETPLIESVSTCIRPRSERGTGASNRRSAHRSGRPISTAVSNSPYKVARLNSSPQPQPGTSGPERILRPIAITTATITANTNRNVTHIERII